jgi:hypothetical protein
MRVAARQDEDEETEDAAENQEYLWEYGPAIEADIARYREVGPEDNCGRGR